MVNAMAPGLVSHVEVLHESPGYTAFLRRLSTFRGSQVIPSQWPGCRVRISESGKPALGVNSGGCGQSDLRGTGGDGLFYCFAIQQGGIHKLGDRGRTRFCAAAHESGSGTIRTSSDVRLESAFRGKADSMCSARVFRLLTRSRRSVLVQNLRAARTIKPNPTTAKPIVTATLTQKTPGFWVRLKRGPPRQVRLSWRHLCWRSRRAS
jgi:hypothetical protein